MKELKIPISCRILPDLKEDIELEAQEAGLTTSLYLEQIIQGRHDLSLDEEPGVDVEALQAENERLQAELKEVYSKMKEFRLQRNDLRQELDQSRKELGKANSSLEELTELIQPLKSLGLFDLSSSEISELEGYFLELEEKYPSYTTKHLLLAALNRTVKNENGMLVIHTIGNY